MEKRNQEAMEWSPIRLKPCPQCNFSAPPTKHRRQFKHFDPHYLECDRCHYQTETKASFEECEELWNQKYQVNKIRKGGYDLQFCTCVKCKSTYSALGKHDCQG
jgi:hypothetical protein